jgi:ParB family chromosome partitioning protein
MMERFADIPADRRFETIRGMDAGDKMALLAVLVASTISATVHNGSVEEARMRKADQYAQAAGLDLAALWAPGVETFGRIRKGGLLAILREECGNEAAENCSKLKGGAGPRHWRASAAWLVAHPYASFAAQGRRAGR